MRTVHFSRDEAPPESINRATESVLIVAPELDDQVLRHLFSITDSIDVNLLTHQDSVAQSGNRSRLRDHVKQLQDINLNVDVRVTDEVFPALTIVDGEHLHCHSEASRRLASDNPDGLAKAIDGLWSRSRPLQSTHQEESATEVSP